jgi:subtilisin family serine protease
VVRRLIVLVSVLTLLLPGAAFAKNPSPLDRFQTLPGAGPIDPQVLPNAMNDARPVTVMLEMRGDPVAVVQSKAPNRTLSNAQRAQVKAQLKGRQNAILGQIRANGGRVLNQLQSAYNGIKVSAPRNKVAVLAKLPNVVAVRGIQVVQRDNEESVPFLNIPAQVWDPTDGLGYTGAGVKIAVIDTGIDYTHANFGGPGTKAAYDLANANDTTIGDAGDLGLFGASAPKVKGGIDLVGDAYDGGADAGSPALIPHPDPDPLDCVFTDGSVGHGSHVSGTATGMGVLADGSTYTGPYDADTLATHDFEIGPGVAPEADLYFVRVFGCDGSTEVTVDAIDWAVDHDMDVINMSLGSSFGRADDPSAVASTNAAAAGVSVVTSAGNSGPSQYITGSPGTGTGAIATAAIDSHATLPGVSLDLTPGGAIDAIVANGISPADGTTYNVVVLTDDPATPANEKLGCSVAAYTRVGIHAGGNQLAVTERGTCARVARAIFGEQAGAAAVAMINNAASLPPYEGPILSNPDNGTPFTVTIPFLGVLGPATSADANALRAASTVSTTAKTLANPGFRGFASFSSGGPRNGDSALKPDISAPGVSIQSTASGTGNKGYVLSGTSMASPHVAGIAALVRQAHPSWTTEQVKAAIVNSGDPTGAAFLGYNTTRAGSGLVTPARAIGGDVVALGDQVAGNPALQLAAFHNATLSFGFAELMTQFQATRTITVMNDGDAPVTLTPSSAAGGGSAAATVSFGAASVAVPAHGQATLSVTLTVPANVGSDAAFRHVSGNVILTGGGNTLRVPYLLVPRALTNVSVSGKLTNAMTPTTFTAANPNGVRTGAVDTYQWGLEDANDVNEAVNGGSGYDVRAVGVQSFDNGDGTHLLVFAINNWDRWSNAAVNEYDINIDTNRDGSVDWVVIGFDLGALTTGTFNGIPASFVLNAHTGALAFTGFGASAPTDSSTILLPVLSNQIGLTSASGAFRYQVASFSLEGPGFDPVSGVAAYDPWRPALGGGFPFVPVGANGSATFGLNLIPTAQANQKPLGAMLVVSDNASGPAEAQLIRGPGNKTGQ